MREIIGIILIAVFWWKFPKLKEFVEEHIKLKEDNTAKIQQVIREEFQAHHDSVKPEDTQKAEEKQRQLEEEIRRREEALRQAEAQKAEEARRRAETERQLEAQRQELEREKSRKRLPPMSDDEFLILCESGDARKVEEAIKNGANVNAKTDYVIPALVSVAFYGHPETASLLRKYGAKEGFFSRLFS